MFSLLFGRKSGSRKGSRGGRGGNGKGNAKEKSMEDVLEELLLQTTDEIDVKTKKINVIHTKKKRTTSSVLLWGLSVWSLLLSIWILFPSFLEDGELALLIKGFVICGLPITYFVRSTTIKYYKRSILSLEKGIELLKKEQKDAIEDFKKKTHYYKAKGLLEKFDESMPFIDSTPPVLEQQQQQQQQQQSPSLPPQYQHYQQLQPQPQPPYTPSWIDKIADSLIGIIPKEETLGRPECHQYALICPNCHSHNGLAPPGQLSVSYICPRCSAFVGSSGSVGSSESVDGIVATNNTLTNNASNNNSVLLCESIIDNVSKEEYAANNVSSEDESSTAPKSLAATPPAPSTPKTSKTPKTSPRKRTSKRKK